MFSRLAILLPLVASTAVVIAAPNALEARTNYCSTGNEYCCNQALSGPTLVSGSIGGVLSGLLGLVGLGAQLSCDPITVIGVSGVSCTQQIACCSGVTTNGLVNVVCSPVNVNL